MSDFRIARLWQSALAERSEDQHAAPRARLRDAFERFRERAAVLAGEIPQEMRLLTVHDITHLDALWGIASLIVGPDVALTPAETFALGGAFLLHDLGLGLAAYPGGLEELESRPEWNSVLRSEVRAILGDASTDDDFLKPPNEALARAKFLVLRALHAERAEKLAKTQWQSRDGAAVYHLIEDPELRLSFGPIIGRVAHSHWWPISELEERFPKTSIGTPTGFPAEWTIDGLKLALILRLADAAHLDESRAPSFLRALRRPEGTAELHWSFQNKLYQVQRDGDRLVYTGRPFTRQDSQAWWLCYDTLRMVDDELRRADDLNADLHRERFAARGVRGVEEPSRLVDMIPTEGWLPVDAQVRVGDVASLVSKLGGHELYGNDDTVPLRELIQNAADAVRARRVIESLGETWGRICIHCGKDEHGAWVEIEDNGIGMSTAVLKGPFLDFGVSYWSTPEAAMRFPTLLSRGFRSTGRYGIGFFSVFMWADRVRVTTRPYDEATRASHVLEFEQALKVRPLLRPAEPTERIKDGGTRVRLWPRGIDDARSNWIQLPRQGMLSLVSERKSSPVPVAHWLCPTLDVDLVADTEKGKLQTIISASDWLTVTGEQLLKRTVEWDHGGFSREVAGKLVRPIVSHGVVVGRACVLPGAEGCISVRGFRSHTRVAVAGVLLGDSNAASRVQATPSVSSEDLAEWATEQARLLVLLDLPEAKKAACARTIGGLGGDVGTLPLARAGGKWLPFEELVQWSVGQDSILIMTESDEEEAHRRGVSDMKSFLVEPHAQDELLVHDFWSRAFTKTMSSSRAGARRRRPVLKAIAAAWHPDDLEVWSGDIAVDRDEYVCMDVEEVKRATANEKE